MMKLRNQITLINIFSGFVVGVLLMMLINLNKEETPTTINYCLEGEVKEIELSVCEECWYEVFDCGNEYQY